MFAQVKDEIFARLGRLKSTNTGFHSRNCMMCISQGTTADTRGRFGISVHDNIIGVNCFNCGFKAVWRYPENFSKQFKTFLTQNNFTADEIQKIDFSLFRIRSTQHTETPFVSTTFSSTWKEIALPKDSLTLEGWKTFSCNDTNFLLALEYAEKRELPLSKVFWSPTPGVAHLDKRITVPFYYQERIVGYTSRLIDGTKLKSVKYFNSEKPLDYVYNLDAQHTERSVVIVCEGVLDALLVDGVSVLGASITNGQANLINQLGKRVILIPDQDATGARLIDQALQHGWEISFPPWEEHIKDPAQALTEYGKLLTLKTIIDFATKDEVAIKLKRKFGAWGS